MKKPEKYLLIFILAAIGLAVFWYLVTFTEMIEKIKNFYIILNNMFTQPLLPFYARITILIVLLTLIFFLYKTNYRLKKEIYSREEAEKNASETQRSLKQSLAIRKATLEAAADGILVIDKERRIVDHNQRLEKMLNAPSKVLQPGNNEAVVDFVLKQLKDPGSFTEGLEQLYNAEPTTEHLDEIRFKNGQIFECYIKPQISGNEVIGRVISFRDITQRKEIEEQLLYQATHDTLTLLPNRIILLDRIQQAIISAKRSKEMGAVLFFDIDRFKLVNEGLGHDIGDIMLQSVAKRLQHCVRENDTVARLGGDEFVVLLTHLTEQKIAIKVANKCLQSLEEPFVIDKHDLSITGSVGISFLPKDGETPIELLKNADSARYYAKSGGRNNYKVYSKEMGDYSKKQLELTNKLHDAVKNNELTLHYQPIVDLKTSSIVSAEALLRWSHSKLGYISPQEFIPIAEDTGLILVIGEWVLYTACHQNRIWQQKGLPSIKMAINLSGQQFKQSNIPDLIEKTLKKTNLDAKYLDVELTESVVMENTQAYLKHMFELKNMGVNLVIDDFGTGYSSLSYLKRFPVNTLKIDLSFVAGLPHNSEDAAIVRAVLAMAKQLNLTVVAEGIETQEQLVFLRNHGCQLGQGYLFSKGVPAEEFEKLLKKKRLGMHLEKSKKNNVTAIKEDILLS